MSLMERVTFYSSREEWQACCAITAPEYSFGATVSATVLGATPSTRSWGSGWIIWARCHAPELLEGYEDEDEVTPEYLTNGLYWEQPVADWYTKVHRKSEVFAHRPLCRVAHPEHPWLRVSPDGFVGQPGPITMTPATFYEGNVEIKVYRWTPDWGRHETVVRPGDRFDGVLPQHVAVQVLLQLACTELPWCDVVVALGFQDLRVIRIMADPGRQAMLVEAVAGWRQTHLIAGDMPDPEDCAAFAHSERQRVRVEEERDATAEEAQLMRRYAARSRRMKADKKAWAIERAELYQALAGLRTLNMPDGRGRIRVSAKGSIRTSKL